MENAEAAARRPVALDPALLPESPAARPHPLSRRRHTLPDIPEPDPFATQILPTADLPPLPSLRRTPRLTSQPPLAVVALNRLAYGPRPGDRAAFHRLGRTARERFHAYVEQQLAPRLVDDGEFEARLAAAGFSTIHKGRAQLWRDHVRAENDDYEQRTLPLREYERMNFLRAVYSRRQLVEVLAGFWHDHFQVYPWLAPVSSLFSHYDRDVIRANLLGNFRAMLEAVYTSPAMLYYLDNVNAGDQANEGLARELFEQHTLGPDRYLGRVRQADVPRDGRGRPAGYVDADIHDAARAFTGWGIDDDPALNDDGAFYYRHGWHDSFQKVVLGRRLPAGFDPRHDGLQVLADVAAHPATARRISERLCQWLVSDSPPASLVAATSRVFLAQRDAPDQLTHVVRHVLRSVEFRTTWGCKVKRPFTVIVGALRAIGADFALHHDDVVSENFLWRYDIISNAPRADEGPPTRPVAGALGRRGVGELMQRQLLNWLISLPGDNGVVRFDLARQTPADANSARDIVDFWSERLLGFPLATPYRTALVGFMADKAAPTEPLPLAHCPQTQTRLRALVAHLLSVPENLRH